jgi:signal transduction histidine kinase
MEAGLRKYQLAVVDLQTLLDESLDRYEFHLQAARIDLIRRLPDEPLHARVDREAIEQVIVNLLSNAVKYMGAPERPSRQVAVALTEENAQIVLRVSDTGIGISEADRVHIFERFYRAENDLVRAVPGSGLGLTLAQAHIVAHGGTIHVESALGQGSTFVISLPSVNMLGDV